MSKPSPTLEFETALWEQGFLIVAGIDEAGRGAWAGPVSAGAVILPAEPDILTRLEGVRDSKLMTPAERETMFDVITANAAAWAVGKAEAEDIDRIGILNATKNAMKRAIEGLGVQPDHLLIDYVRLHDVTIPQTGIPEYDIAVYDFYTLMASAYKMRYYGVMLVPVSGQQDATTTYIIFNNDECCHLYAYFATSTDNLVWRLRGK